MDFKEARIECRAIGVDLFGTLVRPPYGKPLLDLLTDAGICIPRRARRFVARGFFPAMILDCEASKLDAMIKLSLTKKFDSLHEFVGQVDTLIGLTRIPSEAEITNCLRAQMIAISATTLSPSLSEILWRLRRQKMPVVLVSDVSSFWLPIIGKLGLEQWIADQVLSCVTGSLKRQGRTWRAAVEGLGLPAKSAILVGDSWRSDAACALCAGTGAILVGKRSRQVADLLLRKAASLLVIDETGVIRVTASARMALDALLPGLSDEIEADPDNSLVLDADGIIRFSRLLGVSWMPSARFALRRLCVPAVDRHEVNNEGSVGSRVVAQ